MMTQLKIKILAVGSEAMLQRLHSRLDHDEISLRSCSEAIEIPDILQKEPFDMVIVDDLSSEKEAVCQNAVRAGKAPVAVMFRRYGTDWKQLKTLEVDAYFPEEAARPELMARIKAFSRRRLHLAGTLARLPYESDEIVNCDTGKGQAIHTVQETSVTG
jgi:DNA-binding response OmpR family regulator